MPVTQAGLRDAAHRKFKDRALEIRLSTGRDEASLVSGVLPETSGYSHYGFTITTDGTYEQAPQTGITAWWTMGQVDALYSATGGNYQYESAYLVDAADPSTPLQYQVFDSTTTVFDGGEDARVSLMLVEIASDV